MPLLFSQLLSAAPKEAKQSDQLWKKEQIKAKNTTNTN